MPKTLIIDGNSLTLESAVQFARSSHKEIKVKLAKKAISKIALANNFVKNLVKEKKAIYGVNTGFGLLSDVKIPADQLTQLQYNLLRSHASAVGDPLSQDEVRLALLLRANTLAKGHSGVSPQLIIAVLNLLNKGIVPFVPEQGSVGACGDLAPLAHLALVLVGEGEAYYQGKLLPSAIALKKAGLKPIILGPKEGLSLINGTQIMTAIGALVLDDALSLLQHADVAAAMSLEALRGTARAFAPEVQKVRPHKYQILVAKNMRALLDKSEIAKSHINCKRLQDPYSLRCIPQVHGAAREFIHSLVTIIETEMNAATDNPLVFAKSKTKGEMISGGNFHGEYIAIAMDNLAISISEIANIAEQRMQKLINPHFSDLPAFLTPNPGLNSGMMIVQVAAASLVSENKVLAHPASVDSIPTSADKEDHVSMGVTAARKARQIVKNVESVLAMEFLCAAQGLDFLKPLKPGRGALAAYQEIRKVVSFAKEDRAFYLDIEAIRSLIRERSILANPGHP